MLKLKQLSFFNKVFVCSMPLKVSVDSLFLILVLFKFITEKIRSTVALQCGKHIISSIKLESVGNIADSSAHLICDTFIQNSDTLKFLKSFISTFRNCRHSRSKSFNLVTFTISGVYLRWNN
jgi:hypothetical protein